MLRIEATPPFLSGLSTLFVILQIKESVNSQHRQELVRFMLI